MHSHTFALTHDVCIRAVSYTLVCVRAHVQSSNVSEGTASLRVVRPWWHSNLWPQAEGWRQAWKRCPGHLVSLALPCGWGRGVSCRDFVHTASPEAGACQAAASETSRLRSVSQGELWCWARPCELLR